MTDKDDKRIKIVRITDSGRNICSHVMNSMDENHKRILKGFTKEEKQAFRDMLQKMINNS